jgi:hypothetical protein
MPVKPRKPMPLQQIVLFHIFGDFSCLSLIKRQLSIIFFQMRAARMDQKPLSPRYDVVFKNIFGERISILADFLKNVLEVQKAQNAEASPLANWLRFFAAETAEEFEIIYG